MPWSWSPQSGLLAAVNGESGLLLLIDAAHASSGGNDRYRRTPGICRRRRNGHPLPERQSRQAQRGLSGLTLARAASFDTTRSQTARMRRGWPTTQPCTCSWRSAITAAFKVINAADGSAAATLKVGAGADAVMWDGKRRVAFVASGDARHLEHRPYHECIRHRIDPSTPDAEGHPLGCRRCRTPELSIYPPPGSGPRSRQSPIPASFPDPSSF